MKVFLLALLVGGSAVAAPLPVEDPFINLEMLTGSSEEDALLDIIADETAVLNHAQAWARLARILSNKHKFAATVAFAKAMDADPQSVVDDLQTILDLAEHFGHMSPLGASLSRNPGFQLSPTDRNRLAYTAAVSQLREDNLGAALGILMIGDPDAPGAAKLMMIKGVVLAQQSRFDDALDPLSVALKHADQVTDDPEFKNTVQLNIARAYYGSGNYGQAIYNYMQMPRSSRWWLDAQFERSWAHFRAEDMNGALSLLMNHKSPFFEDWYYPEADLLRAYSLFLMCKFSEATKEMDRFVEKYTPIQSEVTRSLSSLSPQQALAHAQSFRAQQPQPLPAYLLRSYRYDPRLEVLKGPIAQAYSSEVSNNPKNTRLERSVAVWTDERVKAMENHIGGQIRDKLVDAQEELGALMQNIEITRIDLLSFETQMYEQAARTGVLETPVDREQLRKRRKARKGMRSWAFEGEYWVDELGHYRVEARPDCPESMQKGK